MIFTKLIHLSITFVITNLRLKSFAKMNQDDTEPCLSSQDNKIMVNASHPADHIPSAVRLNIGDQQKIQSTERIRRCRCWPRRLRFRFVANALISVIVIAILLCCELGYIPQKKLGFTCKDPSISHPYTGDTISAVVLLLGCYTIPLLTLIITELIREKDFKSIRLGLLWFYYKDFLIGGHIILALTELTKVLVGEQRPHFLDVCQPDANFDCIPGTFVEEYTCTNKAYSWYFIGDASRSFPSGHTSLSVFTSIFCAYVVQSRVPSLVIGSVLKALFVVACLSWCFVCSLSRITDRRHHWWDVLAGATLGLLGIIFTLMNLHRKVKLTQKPAMISASTTTLLDVKNKDATSIVL